MEQIRYENGHIEIKNKEKDQEIKLSDLKIKEMKKTVPNTRLRPLRSKRNTIDGSIPHNRRSHGPGSTHPLDMEAEKQRQHILMIQSQEAEAMIKVHKEKKEHYAHYNNYIRQLSKQKGEGANLIQANNNILKQKRGSH